MRRFALVLAAMVAPACGTYGGSGSSENPLEARGCELAGVDPRCGEPCTGSITCGVALFCGSSGRCETECVAPSAGCDAGQICVQARCVGGPVDGGDPCPRIEVSATPLAPTVLLLIDRSASMTEDFHGTSRWQALKTALTDPDLGVLPGLETKVRFGAALYTSLRGEATCPLLTERPPALNNGASIAALLEANSPLQNTPTGEALAAVVPTLLAGQTPENAGPLAIVLATDGEPDTCAEPNPITPEQLEAAKQLSLEATRKAYAQGVKTFVLSLGSDIGLAHLQDLANAGVGVLPGEPGARYFVANSPSELITAFNDIVRGARGCQFTLNAAVRPGSEAGARILLNGAPLTWDSPDGWRLVGGSRLELLGAACTEFKDSDTATLVGSFPCRPVLN